MKVFFKVGLFLSLIISCKSDDLAMTVSPECVANYNVYKGRALGIQKVILEHRGSVINEALVDQVSRSYEIEAPQSFRHGTTLKGIDEKDNTVFINNLADPGCGIIDLDFAFPEPSTEQLQNPITLWATYYYLPVVSGTTVKEGHALRDMRGNPMGPVLSRRDWCNSAMEGSVLVRRADGRETTYNYDGTTVDYQVSCKGFFNHPPSHKVKFREATGKYGDGVSNYQLLPFRSIAVDRTVIPYGTLVYIPAAKGTRFKLPNGKMYTHDGYFFAADTGGLIKKTHIDVYIGTDTKSPFNFIKSKPSGKFKAYIIGSGLIKTHLENAHSSY